MVVLDGTIVNVALPHIQTALGFSDSDLAWIVNVYALVFGGLLLLGGRSGDLLGPPPDLHHRPQSLATSAGDQKPRRSLTMIAVIRPGVTALLMMRMLFTPLGTP